MKIMKVIAFLAMSMFALASVNSHAEERKLVIQVSDGDVKTQTIALNNAVNVQKTLGPGNVKIEVVAYGPGLSIFTKNSKLSQRVASLAMNDEMVFSACGNTMKKIEKKTGKKPVLTDGVKVVPGGVIRIMELQEQGYSYIRP